MDVPDVEQQLTPGAGLGGFVRRGAPASGLRPTIRFVVALALTLFWVGFSIWVSQPWRSELEAAIGPVMALGDTDLSGVHPWARDLVHDLHAADHPLRAASARAAGGGVGVGEWPPVSILVAAWNESASIVDTLEHIAA